MQITKIVVTGGPCGGKSTAQSRIQEHFTKLGYAVLFVPETATELITGGVAPWTLETNAGFQRLLLRLQLEKERVYMEAAAKVKDADKVLIVCDRGAIDNMVYMQPSEFTAILDSFGLNEVELRDSYDAVFHLVTAAKGAEEFYTTANNNARKETPEQAAALDDRLIAAWTGHPHLRIIDNSSDFSGKMHRLIEEIASLLGEPEPLEIERKFLIEYPDMSWLSSLQSCERIEIIQTYLIAPAGDEVRVRQRGRDGHYVYYRTTKRRISPISRIETEQRLSRSEYLRLLMDADTSRRQIRKDRYCMVYNSQYFELDVYPFWKDKAILEIELCDAAAEISLPPELHVIREVTEDPAYSNAALAATAPA